MSDDFRIVVVGLGYVGLPLALALARNFPVMGYDRDERRIEELRSGHDRTHEIDGDRLADVGKFQLTSDPVRMSGTGTFIVAVPTPVDGSNRPQLDALIAATETVGRAIGEGSTVVFESTVYPGVTEEVCAPILERESGFACGEGFFLGYSPERINPGDAVHTVDRIVKVVAGQTPEVAQRLAEIYGTINGGQVFVARDIRTAEAAKSIENAQRDINIAFMNEITRIFGRMGISVYDVLDAAKTKWNFLPFTPGLVGGHCIGVDPYYLAHAAKAADVDPEIVLSGRKINDGMASYFADRISHDLTNGSRILVLGLTFKENVPDLRNTKVVDLVRCLEQHGHSVSVHDPYADPTEARSLYDIDLLEQPTGEFDCVVSCVAHDAYCEFQPGDVLSKNGLIADIKGMWRSMGKPADKRYWTL